MYKFGQQILKNDRIKLTYFNIDRIEMIYVWNTPFLINKNKISRKSFMIYNYAYVKRYLHKYYSYIMSKPKIVTTSNWLEFIFITSFYLQSLLECCNFFLIFFLFFCFFKWKFHIDFISLDEHKLKIEKTL